MAKNKFPAIMALVVKGKDYNDDNLPHVCQWDLHNTEKSEWLKNLESIEKKYNFWEEPSPEDSAKIEKIFKNITEEQQKELNLWNGSEAEIENIQYHLEAIEDEIQEGYTAILVNVSHSQDWEGCWDYDVNFIKEVYIGKDHSENWKDFLKDEQKA